MFHVELCCRCGRQARRPGGRYCRGCHAEAERGRRRRQAEALGRLMAGLLVGKLGVGVASWGEKGCELTGKGKDGSR
jgi:hypothetical protein